MSRLQSLKIPQYGSKGAPARTIYRAALDLYSNPGLLQAWDARRGHARQRNEHLGAIDRGFSSVVENMLEEIQKDPPEILTGGTLCGSR